MIIWQVKQWNNFREIRKKICTPFDNKIFYKNLPGKLTPADIFDEILNAKKETPINNETPININKEEKKEINNNVKPDKKKSPEKKITKSWVT